MIFLIILLTISQMVSFYLIFNKIKPIRPAPKPDGIFLKNIPDKPSYESLDPDHKLVYDVMESAKIENWEVDVKEDTYSSRVWSINFKSPTGIHMMSRIRMNDLGTNLSSFNIVNGDRGFSGSGTISINSQSKIANDIIVFLWDYVIEYYSNINEETREYYKSTIDNISSKLKTLRRSDRLDEILK